VARDRVIGVPSTPNATDIEIPRMRQIATTQDLPSLSGQTEKQ